MIEVAAAALIRPDGQFLLTSRPEGKPYAGYWEFPGGKIEKDESVLQALERELQEELGIRIEQTSPWITQIYAYQHATVRLHFYRVYTWHGNPTGCENQQLSWQVPDNITVSPLLPANQPIIRNLFFLQFMRLPKQVSWGNQSCCKKLSLPHSRV